MTIYSYFLLLCITVITVVSAHADTDTKDPVSIRIEACIDHLVSLKLKQGVITTWVDDKRWSIAHACLKRETRLDEANRCFSEVQTASSAHGLIHDSDVQVTDLLRTWMEFH